VTEARCEEIRYVPPKRRFLQEPQSVTSQTTALFTVTAEKKSNLTYQENTSNYQILYYGCHCFESKRAHTVTMICRQENGNPSTLQIMWFNKTKMCETSIIKLSNTSTWWQTFKRCNLTFKHSILNLTWSLQNIFAKHKYSFCSYYTANLQNDTSFVKQVLNFL
jgi:hypothetical protein